jgi:hypothetical protein
VRDAPSGYQRIFCTVCGTSVPTVDRGVIRVPAGTLDRDPEFGHSAASSSTTSPLVLDHRPHWLIWNRVSGDNLYHRCGGPQTGTMPALDSRIDRGFTMNPERLLTASTAVGLWVTSAGATDSRPEDAVRHIGEMHGRR